MQSPTDPDNMISRLTAVFLLLALCIGFAGYRYYFFQKQAIKNDVEDELSAIADLKLNQLLNWRRERIGEANAIAKNDLIVSSIDLFFREPGTPDLKRDIAGWMKSLQEYGDFSAILLVDAKGTIRMSTARGGEALGPQAKKMVADALRTKQTALSDIHRGQVVDYVHLDLVAPLVRRRGAIEFPVGAVVIHIDPEMFLYPLIETWPGSSRTAETLLVRREGGEVVFLNDVRHKEGTALSFRMPLGEKPGFLAALEQEGKGIIEIRDYRGVPVLAVLRAVPRSSWVLVSKVDGDEIYAPLRERARFLAVVIVMLIAAAGLSIIFWWRQKNAEHLRRQYEDELERKALSERYDSLSKYANDIVLLTDKEDHIVEANDRAVAAYGYGRNELLGLSVTDILPRDARQDTMPPMQQVRERNGLLYETVHRRKDGTVFPVEVSSRVIDIGDKSFFQSIIRDITERKQAELALINEKNRSEAIIAAIGDGISMQDRNFRVLYQNQVHRDLLGLHIGEFCYEAYEHLTTACEGCPVAESFTDGKVHIAERSVQYDDGPRYFEITSSPLRDEGGAIVAGIEAIRDITERKRAENAQLESERRYRRLVESVTDYIYTVEVAEGRAVRTLHGPGCIAVTGYSSEDYAASPDLWFRMIHEEDRPMVLEQTAKILSGAAVPPFEHRIIHKNGSLLWIRNTPVLRFDQEGRLKAYDGLITDITQIKFLENQLRQAQKMEAVGQLAGGVAHDFNNILTAIIGYGNLLLMKMSKTELGRAYVEQILSAAERAAHLTHSLLAFSRKQIIDLKPVNVNDIIRRVEKLLCRVIGEDIEFKVRLEESELTVMADSVQLEQILMNLATNARDAMPEGGALSVETGPVELGEEFVRTHSYGKPGKYALISVTDTGTGMDEKVRSRVFEPFFTTKEQGKGTGLGLAMVYGIVKQHNGYIHVYSEPGRGTTFKLYFPLIASGSVAETAQENDEVRHGTETVLLAEDDVAVRNLTGSVLRDFGYTVIEAIDGEDTVRKFEEHRDRIDLLILDIIMPKKNGKEAYQEIKKLKPGIKALFTSGYTADVVHKKGILETGLDFILKPSSPAVFLKKVREVLDKPNAE